MARIAKMKPCPFCGSRDTFIECMDFGEFEAREVIRPFAERADKLGGLWQEHETHWSPAYGSTEITIGDLRAARRWMEGE